MAWTLADIPDLSGRVAVVTGTALVSQSGGSVEYDLAALAPLFGEASALAHATEPGYVRASLAAVQQGAGWFDFLGDCGDGSQIVGAPRALTRWQAWSVRPSGRTRRQVAMPTPASAAASCSTPPRQVGLTKTSLFMNSSTLPLTSTSLKSFQSYSGASIP